MLLFVVFFCFFFQAEDGIRDLVRSRGLGDVYKRQGVSRVTFSKSHLAARKWLHEEIENSGLEFRMDGAGNHSAFLTLSLIHI